jgi:hypothetical protein
MTDDVVIRSKQEDAPPEAYFDMPAHLQDKALKPNGEQAAQLFHGATGEPAMGRGRPRPALESWRRSALHACPP